MANELNVINSSGQTMYCVVTSGALFLNGTALEAYNSAHWTSYAIAMTDPNSLGEYTGTMPVAAAGYYTPNYFKRVGGTPATTDAPPLAVEPLAPLWWTGTAFGFNLVAINGSGSAASALSFVTNDTNNAMNVNTKYFSYSGNVNANLVSILTTVLTEGLDTGRVATSVSNLWSIITNATTNNAPLAAVLAALNSTQLYADLQVLINSTQNAAPTVAQIDTQLSGTHGVGPWGPGTLTISSAVEFSASDVRIS